MAESIDRPYSSAGEFMHALAKRLWPIHRSITGAGARQTLAILQEYIPNLVIHEVPSGTQAFDWTVPDEWVIRDAYIVDPSGRRIVDIRDNNLHVVGYSTAVDTELTLDELQNHLHSIPDQPDAIPFVTSYYNRTWGFCVTERVRSSLREGMYRAVIDADHHAGSLTYAEVRIPGTSDDEVFLSTYICHPSLANNELSGPVVATALAKWLQENTDRHYSYRLVFLPESIGAITYTSQNLVDLRDRVVAGFQLTCIGDDRAFTYLGSRHGNTRIDRIAQRVLKTRDNARYYSYLDRGSDERTYCAPGVDLPVVSIMRSRYGDYPEYHTSLDDLVSVVTPEGLQGGFEAVQECIQVLENEMVLVASHLGEPQLGKRGLYHTMLNKNTSDEVMLRTNILAYADGQHAISDIAELTGIDAAVVSDHVLELEEHELLSRRHQTRTLRILDDMLDENLPPSYSSPHSTS